MAIVVAATTALTRIVMAVTAITMVAPFRALANKWLSQVEKTGCLAGIITFLFSCNILGSSHYGIGQVAEN